MGFAAKARKILSGYNTCIFTMEKGRAKLLLLAEDLAEGTKEKMVSKARKFNVACRVYGDSDEMSHIIGESGKGIFCITDDNFKKVILNEIDNTKSM